MSPNRPTIHLACFCWARGGGGCLNGGRDGGGGGLGLKGVCANNGPKIFFVSFDLRLAGGGLLKKNGMSINFNRRSPGSLGHRPRMRLCTSCIRQAETPCVQSLQQTFPCVKKPRCRCRLVSIHLGPPTKGGGGAVSPSWHGPLCPMAISWIRGQIPHYPWSTGQRTVLFVQYSLISFVHFSFVHGTSMCKLCANALALFPDCEPQTNTPRNAPEACHGLKMKSRRVSVWQV